jgi:hypothetical protein
VKSSTKIEIRGVLAGAYRGKRKNLNDTLTHAVLVEHRVGERIPEELYVLCRKVKLESLGDSMGSDQSSLPTCPTCATRMIKAHQQMLAETDVARRAGGVGQKVENGVLYTWGNGAWRPA